MLIDQQWLAIPSDALEYRALDGDTGETNGGHWCGAEVAELGMLSPIARSYLPSWVYWSFSRRSSRRGHALRPLVSSAHSHGRFIKSERLS